MALLKYEAIEEKPLQQLALLTRKSYEVIRKSEEILQLHDTSKIHECNLNPICDWI